MVSMRFPIRFDAVYRVLSTILAIAPSNSFVDVVDNQVTVRMAWAFRARFPTSAPRRSLVSPELGASLRSEGVP